MLLLNALCAIVNVIAMMALVYNVKNAAVMKNDGGTALDGLSFVALD